VGSGCDRGIVLGVSGKGDKQLLTSLMSLRPNGTTQLPYEELSFNTILENIQNLLKYFSFIKIL
jgi:hypothetical protein